MLVLAMAHEVAQNGADGPESGELFRETMVDPLPL